MSAPVAPAVEKSIVPATSDSGLYLTLIACHGRCVCNGQTCGGDGGGSSPCVLCSLLDPEWPCPNGPETEDGVYPDPDLVKLEGALA